MHITAPPRITHHVSTVVCLHGGVMHKSTFVSWSYLVSCLLTTLFCNAQHFSLHYMCTVKLALPAKELLVICPPFITLYGHVICNGAVDVRGLMLSNYPVFGSSTFWWCGHTTLVLLNIVPPHITMLEPHCHAWFIVWVCH